MANSHLQNMLPCEICEVLIPFEIYNQHIQNHIFSSMIPFAYDSLALARDDDSDENSESNSHIANPDDTQRNYDRVNLINSILAIRNISRRVESWTHENDEYTINSQIADYIGNVIIGIKNIDKVTSKVWKNTDQNNIDPCPICMDKCPIKSKLRKLKCDHIFCDECIKKWLLQSKRCPICNIDLDEKWG